MRGYLTPVFAALLLAGTAPAQDGDAKKDLQSLQGTWKELSREEFGKKLPSESIPKATFVIEDNRLQFRIEAEKSVREMTFTLDASKTPRAIDFLRGLPDGTKRTVRGIYKIEGDTVTLCFNDAKDGARPTDFASRPRTALLLIVLQRVKK